jgi:hypothetical protein
MLKTRKKKKKTGRKSVCAGRSGRNTGKRVPKRINGKRETAGTIGKSGDDRKIGEKGNVRRKGRYAAELRRLYKQTHPKLGESIEHERPEGMNSILPFNEDFLKDSDNVLILILIFMLMKEKADKTLIIALMSILMQ